MSWKIYNAGSWRTSRNTLTRMRQGASRPKRQHTRKNSQLHYIVKGNPPFGNSHLSNTNQLRCLFCTKIVCCFCFHSHTNWVVYLDCDLLHFPGGSGYRAGVNLWISVEGGCLDKGLDYSSTDRSSNTARAWAEHVFPCNSTKLTKTSWHVLLHNDLLRLWGRVCLYFSLLRWIWHGMIPNDFVWPRTRGWILMSLFTPWLVL